MWSQWKRVTEQLEPHRGTLFSSYQTKTLPASGELLLSQSCLEESEDSLSYWLTDGAVGDFPKRVHDGTYALGFLLSHLSDHRSGFTIVQGPVLKCIYLQPETNCSQVRSAVESLLKQSVIELVSSLALALELDSSRILAPNAFELSGTKLRAQLCNWKARRWRPLFLDYLEGGDAVERGRFRKLYRYMQNSAQSQESYFGAGMKCVSGIDVRLLAKEAAGQAVILPLGR